MMNNNVNKTLNGGHTSLVFSIVILSNDKIISGGIDGKIIIWNINNGDILKTIDAHSDYICSLAKLSKNKIISFSNDKTIKLWDSKSGICLNTLESNTNRIFCLDVS